MTAILNAYVHHYFRLGFARVLTRQERLGFFPRIKKKTCGLYRRLMRHACACVPKSLLMGQINEHYSTTVIIIIIILSHW